MGIENKLIIEQQQNGDRLNYVVSQPPTPTSSGGSFPVLCFLHGKGEAASPESGIKEQLSKHGPLRSESSPKATSQFIVVAPQLPSKDDLWNKYARAVKQIVTKVRENYGGDPKRTYLTGFSRGGNGVFEIALAQPGFWAALWSVDPSKDPTKIVARVDNQEVALDDNQIPVWLDLGKYSRPREESFRKILRLKRAANYPNGDFLYKDREKNHVCTSWSAYEDDQVYNWLLTKHL